MRNPGNERYVKLGVTGVVVAIVAIFAYFLMAQYAVLLDFLNSVGKILMPFLYGAVIAYLLAPLCNTLEDVLRRRVPGCARAAGGLSIVLALLLAFAVVLAFLMLVIPSVVRSVVQMVNAVPDQMAAATQWFHELLEAQPDLQDSFDELSANAMTQITSWLETDLLTTVQTLASSLSTQLVGIVNAFKNVFLGLLISVYLLVSRKKFARQALMLLYGAFPQKWAQMIEAEVRYADKMFNGFLVGRIVDSAIIGLICFAFTAILRFDSAVLVSVVVGVTNVVPVFGPILGAVPCAFILLLENPLHCLIFIVFVIVLQFIDGNIIGPRILGETTGVSSFWVLFSVLLFGGLWGLVGMIVGVPLFAVIYDILKRLVYLGLHAHGRDDLLPKAVRESDEAAGKRGDAQADDGAAPDGEDAATQQEA